MSDSGKVLVVGCEPAAFSCCFALLENGLSVQHILPEPLGLSGSSRDIGLAYPELGEPIERVEHAIGTEHALELHNWPKKGIEDLSQRLPDQVVRGSRLSVTRTEQEGKLLAADAIYRNRPEIGDEVRLMSGAAASNYAPLDDAELGAFETHVAAFAPVAALKELWKQLKTHKGYACATPEISEGKLQTNQESVQFVTSDGAIVGEGDLAVVAHGLKTTNITSHLSHALVPKLGQAFRTPPLKEKSRTSVVGITASWGYERYRFDSEYRLLGCGIDPTRGTKPGEEASVIPEFMERFAARASQLFSDFDGSVEDLMQWGVLFTGSCDGLPIIGPLPGEPRIQVAAGFGISSWSRGWHAGRLLGMTIAGAEQPSPLFQRCTSRRFLPSSKN